MENISFKQFLIEHYNFTNKFYSKDKYARWDTREQRKMSLHFSYALCLASIVLFFCPFEFTYKIMFIVLLILSFLGMTINQFNILLLFFRYLIYKNNKSSYSILINDVTLFGKHYDIRNDLRGYVNNSFYFCNWSDNIWFYIYGKINYKYDIKIKFTVRKIKIKYQRKKYIIKEKYDTRDDLVKALKTKLIEFKSIS